MLVKIKGYFATWSFARYFRVVLSAGMLVGYFSTGDGIYLAGSAILLLQAVFNMGCVGGACATPTNADKKQKPVMEFEKYEPGKQKLR